MIQPMFFHYCYIFQDSSMRNLFRGFLHLSKINIRCDKFQYTREEIEWYGLNLKAACSKVAAAKAAAKKIEPLKLKYRSELIAQLKAAKIREAENVDTSDRFVESRYTLCKKISILTYDEKYHSSESSWISKINPFAKSSKTE